MSNFVVYTLKSEVRSMRENERVRMSKTEERIKQLNEIKEKVKVCETQLNGFLQELGWTREKLPKLSEVKEEIVEPERDVAGSNFSGNSRKNVINQDVKPIDLETVVNLCSKIDQKRSTTSNFIDLNKLKRDLKRRRVKYRTSTAPLTYTEELRELIELQMDLVKGNKQD